MSRVLKVAKGRDQKMSSVLNVEKVCVRFGGEAGVTDGGF